MAVGRFQVKSPRQKAPGQKSPKKKTVKKPPRTKVPRNKISPLQKTPKTKCSRYEKLLKTIGTCYKLRVCLCRWSPCTHARGCSIKFFVISAQLVHFSFVIGVFQMLHCFRIPQWRTGWYCRWYRCFQHLPVALEVRYKGGTQKYQGCDNVYKS